MTHLGFLKHLCLFLLLGAVITGSSVAQDSADLAGEWVIKLGNRVFIVVTLTPASESSAHLTGSLALPRHFSTGGGDGFSNIKGPTIHSPIVRSSTKGKCISFATQDPADKDEDNFQLCVTGQGRGTLRIDVPGFEPWPVTKEKGSAIVATDWDSTKIYYLEDGDDVSSAQMQQIFEEDQKVRQPSIGKIDWAVVNKSDAARREATRKLLTNGRLHTGEDFERAAFVFQHGDTADDYLLAHTLAVAAVARGQSSAIWIASATLDRFLNSIHQPQIYGTQFYFKTNEPTTQEPYNRGLIPDALRRFLGVPSQAAQEEQRKHYEADRSQP